MTTTKTKATTKKFVKQPFVDSPLPILYSCRMRLDEEQRSTLKSAYAEAQRPHIPANLPTIGGSSVSVSTEYGAVRDLDYELGMSRTVVYDLINSRDTISIVLILKLQAVLKVEIVSPETMQKAFDSYLNYIFTQND